MISGGCTSAVIHTLVGGHADSRTISRFGISTHRPGPVQRSSMRSISMPNASEESVAGKMPAMRPPETMAILSQVCLSSSSSEEIITTVTPD